MPARRPPGENEAHPMHRGKRGELRARVCARRVDCAPGRIRTADTRYSSSILDCGQHADLQKYKPIARVAGSAMLADHALTTEIRPPPQGCATRPGRPA